MTDENHASQHHLPRGRRLAAAAGCLLVAIAASWYFQIIDFRRFGLLGGAGSKRQDSQTAAPVPAPVHAAIVEQRDVASNIYGLGTVQPWNTVSVRSRVDGQIEKLNFREGEIVKTGDVLIELDDRPFVAARDQAKAKITQDQANQKSAGSDLERTTTLNKNGYATKQLFDQQTANVAQLAAQLTLDKAALENAETQLAYTKIVAPITGRVGLRNIDAGNIIHAGDQGSVITITQIDPIAVIFTAPENQLTAINLGTQQGALRVTAYSSDRKTKLADGELAVVDNLVDVNSGTIRLKAKFDNAKNVLWPGMSVSTQLVVAILHNVVVVPDSAVQRGPDGLVSYVITPDNKAELRHVKAGQIQDGQTVILSGLAANEMVVTSGQYKVVPGGPVEVLDVSQQRTAAGPDQRTVN